MKKYLLITMLFCCLMGFAQNGRIDLRSTTRADITKSDFTTLQATFSYGSIESVELSTEKGSFSEIALEGCYPSGEIGTPELPATHQLLAVPFGANPTVRIESFTATDYKLSEYGIKTILPHQPSVRKDQKPEDVEFIYDAAAYQTRGLSSEPTATIEVQGTMRGIRVGSLVVNPLSYDPMSNTLRVFNDIEVTVDFVGADQAETERMLLNTYSPYYDIVYKQMFNSRQILDVYDDHPDLGRFALFRNHSKVYAGTGPLFSFGIQSSANINTNPRTENTCVTIDRGLFEFYKAYYDGIKSFE